MTTRTVIVTNDEIMNQEVDNLLDSMIDAQVNYGQITWTAVRMTWAAGTYPVGDNDTSRVAVIDLDSADGLEIAILTAWAFLNPGVELPE